MAQWLNGHNQSGLLPMLRSIGIATWRPITVAICTTRARRGSQLYLISLWCHLTTLACLPGIYTAEAGSTSYYAVKSPRSAPAIIDHPPGIMFSTTTHHSKWTGSVQKSDEWSTAPATCLAL